MKTKNAVLSIVMLSCALPIAWAQATVPAYVNYQGTLSDAAGQPLATGYYAMSFRVFPSATATTATWGPQVFDGTGATGHGPTIYVSNGVFNVVLGPVDTSNRTIAGAFVAAERYIEVTMGSNPPIQPRQQILAAPYALRSADSVPVGGIVPFFGNPAELPPNWKICDGTAVNDPYSPLNSVIVPNLRNVFLRGENDTARNLVTAGVNTGGTDSLPSSSGSSSVPSHTHPLPPLTGRISNSGDDPCTDTHGTACAYNMRDDNGWTNNCRVETGWCSSSENNNWEGHHYHYLGGAASGQTGSTSHSHSIGGDNRPVYRALHFIIRIR